MKKLTLILLAALLVSATAVYAAQDTVITIKEVRNPKKLKVYLEANATDAESRLVSGSTTSADQVLVNLTDTGTSSTSWQADRADNAGDKSAWVQTDGSGIAIQTDADSKGTLATKVTIGTGGLVSTLVGIDAIGAVDLDVGSADVTDVTVTTDGGTVILDGTVTAGVDLTATGDVNAGDDCIITDDCTVGGLATVAETLAVVGVATFTAESVHNAGLDADGITVDASDGIDTKTAGALLVGDSTATSIEIGDAGVTTEVQGPLTVLQATGQGIDVNAAGALFLGESTATSVSIGASDIDTTILGPLNVLEATGKGIDTTGAGALHLGEGIATSVSIGQSDAPTVVLGAMTVLGGIDTTAAATLVLGAATANKVEISDTTIEIEAEGPLNCEELLTAEAAFTLTAGALTLPYANKTANYTNAATDVILSYNTSAVTTNTLPEASTVLGHLFIVALQDDDGDLVVMTDGTDKFDGTNDILTFADAGDSCQVMATGANVYTILVNVGGALSN